MYLRNFITNAINNGHPLNQKKPKRETPANHKNWCVMQHNKLDRVWPTILFTNQGTSSNKVYTIMGSPASLFIVLWGTNDDSTIHLLLASALQSMQPSCCRPLGMMQGDCSGLCSRILCVWLIGCRFWCIVAKFRFLITWLIGWERITFDRY